MKFMFCLDISAPNQKLLKLKRALNLEVNVNIKTKYKSTY